MGAKKTKICHQREKCIGCGSCAIYSKDHWTMNPNDGKADLKDAVKKGSYFVTEIDDHDILENKKAADACPMNIIRIEEDNQ